MENKEVKTVEEPGICVKAGTLKIDSDKVGGGQVFRHLLALLALFLSFGVQKLELTNIRSCRPKPGLHAQALACISAVGAIFGETIKFVGAELGSLSVGIDLPHADIFTSSLFPKRIEVNVGTAGSTSLVLQALLGILPFGTVATIIGGTNVDFAPPTDHVELVLIPMLALWGISLVHTTLRRGVHPHGGGKVEFSMDRTGLKPFTLIERGDITRVFIRVVSASANLNIESFVENLKTAAADLTKYPIVSEYIQDRFMGNKKKSKTQIICVIKTTNGCRLSESVILDDLVDTIPMDTEKMAKFVGTMKDMLSSSATFDEHTADQVLLPMALAAHAAKTNPDVGHNGVSAIRVAKVDGVDHITSAFDTFKKLLPTILFSVQPCKDGSQIISCSPNPDFDPARPYGSAISELA